MNSPAKTLLNGRENSSRLIPIDIISEILLRLPMKSVARFSCVSKLWASTVGLPYFTELFITRSSARPQLLFAYRGKNEFVFLSSPQPSNPDENSSPVAVKHLSDIPFGSYQNNCYISGPVNGLVCLTDNYVTKGPKMSTVHRICNPSTGQALTLPKAKKTRMIGEGNFFETMSDIGYDPIYKQFKVLSLRYDLKRSITEHQVLTLGTDEPIEWRVIEGCCIPHYSRRKGICINGVLYYKAEKFPSRSCQYIIVCFHVRSETFSCIELDTSFKKEVFGRTMINYNGRLGSVSNWSIGGALRIELLVIGDSEKQEWSRHKYILSPVLNGKDLLHVAGVTGINEIVLSHPSYVSSVLLEDADAAACGQKVNIKRNKMMVENYSTRRCDYFHEGFRCRHRRC